MFESIVKIGDIGVRISEFEAVVVGSGASGFNAASRLHSFGVRNICLVAEHVNAGTSRNTGSDKQTYYKLSLSGGEADSVGELAVSLFAGGCVDGDTALAEAALSARCFFRLVELGVPFPHDDYGQYVGYKTDHDPKRRATSAGPYTSKMMTEALEDDVRSKSIPILDRMQVIRILYSGGRVSGILCLDTSRLDDQDGRYVILRSGNVVWATGGPAGIYADSVYPQGQYGSSGLAFEAGVPGQNLTEWQYGLASARPRWNVSGSYMQVLPRFISTNREGSDEKEFLGEYFTDSGKELSAIFLKGYQWPFDSAKALSGSSLIDILVYVESRIRGRRVFLDFRSNKGGGAIEWNSIAPEAWEYLEKAGACFGTPVERLMRMNEPAYTFYRERGVDLAAVPLEIALSAQHNNGGLCVDSYWQTRLEGFFAVGEVAGTHGVHRPGGSALNAGQVGSLRAASFIAAKLAGQPGRPGRPGRPARRNSAWQASRQGQELPSDVLALAAQTIEFGEKALGAGTGLVASRLSSPEIARRTAASRMSASGAAFRSRADIAQALDAAKSDLVSMARKSPPELPSELPEFHRLRDCLISQIVYLSAMKDYIDHGGKSRGSALYNDPAGVLPHSALNDSFRFTPDSGELDGLIQEVSYSDGECECTWRPTRPIPAVDDFFENVWREFREGEIVEPISKPTKL